MKKIVIAVFLLGGVTAFAFASLNGTKKADKKVEHKKECRHHCPYSSEI
jgi:hypothetical protein